MGGPGKHLEITLGGQPGTGVSKKSDLLYTPTILSLMGQISSTEQTVDLNILDTYKLGSAILSDALISVESSTLEEKEGEHNEDFAKKEPEGGGPGVLLSDICMYGCMDVKYAKTLNRLAEILAQGDQEKCTNNNNAGKATGSGKENKEQPSSGTNLDANKAMLMESSSPSALEAMRMLRKRYAILKVSSLG